MLYTQQVKSRVHEIKVPHEFIVDIVEYNMNPPFLSLRFYESQWMHYTEAERLTCIKYIEQVRKVLTGFGINSTIEPIIDTGESLPDKYKRQQ